jgi:hypothetical protein
MILGPSLNRDSGGEVGKPRSLYRKGMFTSLHAAEGGIPGFVGDCTALLPAAGNQRNFGVGYNLILIGMNRNHNGRADLRP